MHADYRGVARVRDRDFHFAASRFAGFHHDIGAVVYELRGSFFG
jgi:hypothetical protein